MARRHLSATIPRPALPAEATPGRGGNALGVLGFAMLVGMAAFAGEWLVHQIAYGIVYGSRFSAVMASTPHRLYMAPVGAALALFVAAVFVSALVLLYVGTLRRRQLLSVLPTSLHPFVPAGPIAIEPEKVVWIGLGLAGVQSAIYVLQENLESLAEGHGLPGLSVVLAAPHLVVAPLQVLVALCSAFVICTVVAWFRGSRAAERVARRFVAFFGSRVAPPVSPSTAGVHIPSLRLLVGSLCLRSPPLTA